MQRTARAAIGVLLLAAISARAYAVSFTASGGPDLPRISDASGAVPAFVVGPYVQNVTPHAATIMWQADRTCIGELTVSGGAWTKSYSTPTPRCLGEVRLGDLAADTRYTYALRLAGSGQKAGASASGAPYWFRTFPDASRPIRFIVYGDTRTNPERHRRVIDAMASATDIDFVLHTGDLVSSGSRAGVWAPEFFGPAARLMRCVPFYTVLGNHEGNSDLYFRHLSLPGNERWYSFDVADVHVIGLDSNSDFDRGSPQYLWLLADLAAHRDAKWKFVFMHHPVYSSSTHAGLDETGRLKERGSRQAREILPALAARFGISAIFAGHDHTYERSERDGVNYIVAGGGGAPNYGEQNAEHNPFRRKFYSGLHYCLITVAGDNASMIVRTPEAKIIDRAEMTRRTAK